MQGCSYDGKLEFLISLKSKDKDPMYSKINIRELEILTKQLLKDSLKTYNNAGTLKGDESWLFYARKSTEVVGFLESNKTMETPVGSSKDETSGFIGDGQKKLGAQPPKSGKFNLDAFRRMNNMTCLVGAKKNNPSGSTGCLNSLTTSTNFVKSSTPEKNTSKDQMRSRTLFETQNITVENCEEALRPEEEMS